MTERSPEFYQGYEAGVRETAAKFHLLAEHAAALGEKLTFLTSLMEDNRAV